MTPWQAILLGLVEGLTEYLPVSSTGHLLLVQRALGIAASPGANAYAIAIQGGAIVAVLLLYRRRVARLGAGLLGRDAGGRRLLGALVAALLPAAVLGPLVEPAVEARLFGLGPVAAAWVVGGVAILLVGRRSARGPGRPLEALGPRGALAIGLLQCVAFWPGVSRSLVTIVGGLLVGLSTAAAVEFSFLLGLLTLGAATAWKAWTSWDALTASYDVPTMLAGFAAALVSALLAVRWLVAWLQRHGFALFGWYRVALGLLVAALLAAGLLGP